MSVVQEGIQPQRKGLPEKRTGLHMLQLLGWLLLLCYYPVSMAFIARERVDNKCERIAANVSTRGSDVLITQNGLQDIVKRSFPSLIGTRLSEVDYDEIEKTLEEMPVVSRCEAYPSEGGTVHVEIKQRQPVMRVFTSDGSYYMDAEGFKITATSEMKTHTVIVNGYVNSMLNIDDLVRLCNSISSDKFWKAMIEQVYVTQEHEFVLVPRIGDHIVEFGSADGMSRKFADLKTLYQKGWSKDEWNVYKKVNMKFKGQIVCTKR